VAARTPPANATRPPSAGAPLGGHLRRLDEMLDLAAKHSALIMATVPFEHHAEIDGPSVTRSVGVSVDESITYGSSQSHCRTSTG
jgi:hypothetical protein